MVSTLDSDQLIKLIQESFTEAEFPGVGNLHQTSRVNDDEAEAVTTEFSDKTDWRTLDATFLDNAPMRFGSALSFFTTAAFRFYMPAYLIAEIRQLLNGVDVGFYLTFDFTNAQFFSTDEKDQRMLAWMRERCSTFTRKEIHAIIAFLEYVANSEDPRYAFDQEDARQALKNYWYVRGRFG